MSILVNKDTRLICQGITGKVGEFHTSQCIAYGTNVVGGVTPGKGGQTVQDVPVFDTVEEAVAKTKANATMIFVPPAFTADAILEALDAGIDVIVAITEGVPVLDMVDVYEKVSNSDAVLIGPNCPGVITPDECKIGIMPGYIHNKGKVGVMSRSGTLTYEAVWQTSNLGLGQTTCVGLGGRPDRRHFVHRSFEAIRSRCRNRSDLDDRRNWRHSRGRSGGLREGKRSKPVAAFIAGRTAPPGKRMGHAGAIISGGKGTATEKIAALEDAGIAVAQSPAEMGEAVVRAIEKK